MQKTLKVSYVDDWEKPYIRLSGYWLTERYGIKPGDTITLDLMDGFIAIQKKDVEN
jgi:hypothetical protein